MKRKIAVLLSLSLMVILSNCGEAPKIDEYYHHGYYEYKFIDKHKQSVSFCGVSSSWKEEVSDTLYIPETIYSLNVVKIGTPRYDFSNYKGIRKIIIPSTVKIIEDNAFKGAYSLEEISIPDSITSIGRGAFAGCSALKEITLPASVKSIGERAFAGCKSLVSVNAEKTAITEIKALTFFAQTAYDNGDSVLKICLLPPSLTSIGESAFGNCKRLENIAIPDKVATIEKEAFGGCFSLKEITLPASLKNIGENAFRDCSELTRVTFADTNSWYVKYPSSSSWTAVTVTNPATNAEYLKNTYKYRHWEKRL